jgi:ribosomal subunit interface protein
MRILFSSKTFEMTGKMKQFVQKKFERLGKFSRLGIEQLQVIVDRVKRGGRTTSQAQVEVVAKIRGAQFAFREIGDNAYQAFYRVYEKIEKKMRREKRERTSV